METTRKTVNPAGNPKITDSRMPKHKASKGTERPNQDAPNPRHREDFDRLLKGMARSSE
jgi:hypothetical protein